MANNEETKGSSQAPKKRGRKPKPRYGDDDTTTVVNVRLPDGAINEIDYWVNDKRRYSSRSDFIQSAVSLQLHDLAYQEAVKKAVRDAIDTTSQPR